MAMTSEWLRGVTFSGFGFRRLVCGSGVTFSGFSFDRQVHGSGVTFPGFGFGFRLRFLIVHDSNQVTLVTGNFNGLEEAPSRTPWGSLRGISRKGPLDLLPFRAF